MSFIEASQALVKLSEGDIVALPTETVYGLCGKIDSEAAVKKIFAVKKRPCFDPLIVHVPDIDHAKNLCQNWPEIYTLLAEKFWPGPLTLICKKRETVSDIITAGLNTVAVRVPNHPVFLEILKKLGAPLAAPSANRFSHTSPTTAQHVVDEFSNKVDVVDGGPCLVGVESTVIFTEKKGLKWIIKILRPGGVERSSLFKFLSENNIDFEIQREVSVASPGHLKEHYRPASPLVLLQSGSWNSQVQNEVEKTLGRKISGAVQVPLQITPQETARHLYANFRRLASDTNHVLWISKTADQCGEDWEAIWDRVERASSLVI